MTNSVHPITTGIAWCLAWGDKRKPQLGMNTMQSLKKALKEKTGIPDALQPFVEQVSKLDDLEFPETAEELSQILEKLQQENPKAWNTSIGLVYGGATKIKQYVFEAAKLPDIRGASTLLDRINLIDIPAFFGEPQKLNSISTWLNEHFPDLEAALIKELIIYYKGGNILAFCPAAFVHELADAIEKRYTEETLTANSCAVGDTFQLLEIRFGLLQNPIENTPWLDWYQRECGHQLVKAYFGESDTQNSVEQFQTRKSFNELVSKLTILFNQRRSGNNFHNRPTRRYPPMFETHPYLQRDEGERRLAVTHATELPGEPWFSETLARKRLMGEITKREVSEGELPAWYKRTKLKWRTEKVESWVYRFEKFLGNSEHRYKYYQSLPESKEIKEAQSLTEIGNASNGFVGYIYADGNNMGGYIQKRIKTPENYKQFSEDIFQATEEAVYQALSKHLKPHELQGLTRKEHYNRNGDCIHPFEILTIGGDDVLLVVPADKALAVAKTIGEEFENYLKNTGRYNFIQSSNNAHRYQGETPPDSHCELSMSIGVLITAYSTPIYYAKTLYEQLLKSAKQRAKTLKDEYQYHGGTVDFLILKSVTMISSNIGDFRKEGLTKRNKGQTLKFYAAPYTLHELGGLLKTAEALNESKFPRSQLYQIRSLLEQGKHTAILNYRYFRVRLEPKQQKLLAEWFEKAWCQAKTNEGNLAPWMYILPTSKQEASTYETIWRELVELYPFIDESVTQPEKEVSR